MKNFVKHFVGKGRQVGELPIIKLTCKLEELEKFAYSYDGVKFVSIEVSKMKTQDNFGRDYTVYVSVLQESTATKKEDPETSNGNEDTISEEQSAPLEECPVF